MGIVLPRISAADSVVGAAYVALDDEYCLRHDSFLLGRCWNTYKPFLKDGLVTSGHLTATLGPLAVAHSLHPPRPSLHPAAASSPSRPTTPDGKHCGNATLPEAVTHQSSTAPPKFRYIGLNDIPSPRKPALLITPTSITYRYVPSRGWPKCVISGRVT